MAVGKLFIGKSVRELRLSRNWNQVQFAERLGISTSYLNQIESNNRPVSATVLLALVDKFQLQLSEIAGGEGDRLLPAFSEALNDPLFETLSPTVQDIKLVVQNAPSIAHAVILAHQAYRRSTEQLAGIDQELAKGMADATPYEEVRDYFHFVDNYVHDLDIAAERLAISLRLPEDSFGAMKREVGRCGVSVLHVVDEGSLRSFDTKTSTLYLNKHSPVQTQQFQMAVQLAQLEFGDSIAKIASAADFQTEEAAEICKIGLQNYFAGALLMPYCEFAKAATILRHDVELLALQFNTSIEQVCHRLSTLQRPGQKGVPMFFARIDRAGNITKRHSATKLQFARFGAACPVWNVHRAFEAQGRILRQLAETPDGGKYLSLALQVTKRSGGFRGQDIAYALAFGCEMSNAEAFVYADNLLDTAKPAFEPIGVSCRICERPRCPSRAWPPMKGRIGIDHHQRMTVPYEIN
ncbi:helix-turn-helix domain-containing protein [Agrobacterium tumefaciens]|jgi:predicted transcriptional regulator/transcriptional regulator with XRE-family HTH domain|uniref:ImmA/IrrE family metallo-endopeptidase n=1 Tax=Agrobacterium tumefaciens TaxID=358 RepID=A0A4D7YNV2_AGRTU|nr:helix-turn-helix transcriptional regulator [Agrobacterium tumefaciens]QCL98195.1 ImmA/IrrE family metallo-endopeptidase [Agrobacterium tumefaciens]